MTGRFTNPGERTFFGILTYLRQAIYGSKQDWPTQKHVQSGYKTMKAQKTCLRQQMKEKIVFHEEFSHSLWRYNSWWSMLHKSSFLRHCDEKEEEDSICDRLFSIPNIFPFFRLWQVVQCQNLSASFLTEHAPGMEISFCSSVQRRQRFERNLWTFEPKWKIICCDSCFAFLVARAVRPQRVSVPLSVCLSLCLSVRPSIHPPVCVGPAPLNPAWNFGQLSFSFFAKEEQSFSIANLFATSKRMLNLQDADKT